MSGGLKSREEIEAVVGEYVLITGAMNDTRKRQQMLREHDAAGEKSLYPWHGRDHSQRLYMLLVLSIWSKWLASLETAA